ncbi:MAG: type I restriction enzyme HsdR N-terminal domain-containing protein [Lepagella sp.]
MDINWCDICQDFVVAKDNNYLERDFQRCVKIIFRHFLRWNNNIVEEESIHVGSVQKIRADFMLYKDDVPVVAIECKRPNHIQSQNDREQLQSYMRQKKVDFGLYIGENIQLFYDDPADTNPIVRIFTLDYSEDDTYSSIFLELFTFSKFDKNQLTAFCVDKIDDIKLHEELDRDFELILSNQGKDLLRTLLRDYLLGKGYSEQSVDNRLDDVEISIKDKISVSPIAISPIQTDRIRVAKDVTPKERKLFSINGKGLYNKSRCALELIRMYTNDHPSPYDEVTKLFNRDMPHFVMTETEVNMKILSSKDTNISTRWHINQPLLSSDGIRFYVTTQIGDNCRYNFKSIVKLAELLGYTIKPVN